ncbi:hypothetical protein D9M73_154140 [compost metagenome]
MSEGVDDLETFQLVPVVLAVGEFREQVARHADLITGQKTSFFAIIETLELCDQELVIPASADQLYLLYIAVTLERPGFVIQQVLNRISKGVHLHFAANAVNRINLADNDQIISNGWRRVHIAQAAALADSFNN